MEETKKSKKKLIIVICIILAALAAGAGAFFFWPKQKDPEPMTEENKKKVAAFLYNMEGLYFFEKEDYVTACKFFDKAYEKESDDYDYKVNSGISLFMQGKYDEAAVIFDDICKNCKDDDRSVERAIKYSMYCDANKGFKFMEAGEAENAISFFDSYLSKTDMRSADAVVKEYNGKVLYSKLCMLEAMTRWEEAYNCAQEYLKYYPDNDIVIKESDILRTRF